MRAQDVPASHGWLWIKEGFALFRKAPLMWLVLTMLWSTLIIAILLLLWPVGAVVALVLYPAFVAIWIRAGQQVDKLGALEIGLTFTGLSRSFGQLLALGGMILLAQSILLTIASFLIPIDPELQQLAAKYPQQITTEELQAAAPNIMKIAMIQLAATMPVFIAAWLAPPLIVLRAMTAWHAMRWSIYACVANLGALVVYGLVGALAIAAISFAPPVLELLMIIAMAPIFFATIYTAYRDIFVD